MVSATWGQSTAAVVGAFLAVVGGVTAAGGAEDVVVACGSGEIDVPSEGIRFVGDVKELQTC